MERLTKTYSDGTHGASDFLPCGENSYDYNSLLIEKLGKYEDLEEHGRLIKLPCNVGDEIFLDFAGFKKDIDEFTVKGFHLDCIEDGENILYCDYESHDKTLSGQIDVMEFGNTVFLTKSEAEKKLKEMEKNF